MIIAYIMRHGSTYMSPKPEGWLQVGLDTKGWREAREGAYFLHDFIKATGPKPALGISSDLVRAFQTLAIVASLIQIPTRPPDPGIRAFDESKETPSHYEERNIQAFERLLGSAERQNVVPLIVCHRSSTAFLAGYYKMLLKNPDYAKDALLHEGGVLGITSEGTLLPLFRTIEENWPHGYPINTRS